jgi:hypothetical protein
MMRLIVGSAGRKNPVSIPLRPQPSRGRKYGVHGGTDAMPAATLTAKHSKEGNSFESLSQNYNASMLCPVIWLDMDRDQSIREFCLDGSFEPIADIVGGADSHATRYH